MTLPSVRTPVVQFVVLAIALGAIAMAAPDPTYATDRDTYIATGQQVIVPDCSDIHCFRVLVTWVLESLPGPSLLKWKTYAVLANAGAAVALGRLCLMLGLSIRASNLATWLAAFGFGSLYTLYDVYTSDPLMFLLGPLLTSTLLAGHRIRAGLIASIGILAKEFAAAPLWIMTIWAALQRRWAQAFRLLLSAMSATLVWLALQVTLIVLFNYTYGENASADLLGGGYLARWLSLVQGRVALAVMFVEFGALYLLFPVGLIVANRDLRLLALAALPEALVLLYVQQPDRALWNFHFIVIPIAVLVLERLPERAGLLFAACFAFANLRIGAQLTFVPPARIPLVASLLIAGAAIVATFMKRSVPPTLAAEAGM